MATKVLYREILRQGSLLETKIPQKGIEIITKRISKKYLKTKTSSENTPWRKLCKNSFRNFKGDINVGYSNALNVLAYMNTQYYNAPKKIVPVAYQPGYICKDKHNDTIVGTITEAYEVCERDEEYIEKHSIDHKHYGRYQPFYTVFNEKFHTRHLIAQEDIEIISDGQENQKEKQENEDSIPTPPVN
eukprot:TRINITY_DN12343_c0_g1_i1.p1 TRINITY_DN12343_c0_g1~~TRINITY_DN12343_c0_g1_i1.p1  ORF type:complete len:188 (-),score=39.68 TRINITY_DN12343_c0_g1_i1:29-592(-)